MGYKLLLGAQAITLTAVVALALPGCFKVGDDDDNGDSGNGGESGAGAKGGTSGNGGTAGKGGSSGTGGACIEDGASCTQNGDCCSFTTNNGVCVASTCASGCELH